MGSQFPILTHHYPVKKRCKVLQFSGTFIRKREGRVECNFSERKHLDKNI